MRSRVVRAGRARRLAAALLAAIVCVGVGVAADALTASGGPPPSGPARIAGPLHGFPGAYVRGSGLFRAAGAGRAALEEGVSSPLAGSLSPVATSSPDGRFVAYDVWRRARFVDPVPGFTRQGIGPGDPLGTPIVRLYDTTTGKDKVLQDGAYSHAWRADGGLAVVRGVNPQFDAGGGYPGRIVVRDRSSGPAKVWTPDPAQYVAVAWAGSRLVAYRIGAGEEIETLVVDGPGSVRVLAEGSVVAISPDGRQALVTDDETLRVLDVASGAETARLSLADVRDLATGSLLGPVSYAGSWSGDRVLAAASSALAVFRVDGGRISVEQVLELDPSQFPAGVQEPRFADGSANTIVAVAETPPAGGADATNFLVSCDRGTRTCERGEPAPATDWIRLVRDDGATEGGN